MQGMMDLICSFYNIKIIFNTAKEKEIDLMIFYKVMKILTEPTSNFFMLHGDATKMNNIQHKIFHAKPLLNEKNTYYHDNI